jgi:hypothetical protein
VSSIYERAIRSASWRCPEWVTRCRTQAAGALAALAREPWPADARLSQPETTTACMLRYVQMVDPRLLPAGALPHARGLVAAAKRVLSSGPRVRRKPCISGAIDHRRKPMSRLAMSIATILHRLHPLPPCSFVRHHL